MSDKFAMMYSKISGKPLPFLYASLEIDQNFIIPLKLYANLLANDRPSIVSLGPGVKGKSNLLNNLFFTSFTEHDNDIIHDGVDVVFSSEEF